MRCAAPRIVGGGFRFGHDLVDAFLRVRLAHAGARGDELRDVGSIARREAFAIAEVGGPQTQDFGARLECASSAARGGRITGGDVVGARGRIGSSRLCSRPLRSLYDS